MDSFNKKFVDSLIEIEKKIKSADNFANVAYPVVKDPKLLLRGMESLSGAVVECIALILKYEFIYGRIKLSKDKEKNLAIFYKVCSKRYQIDEKDIDKLAKILSFRKKQKDSVFEFSRPDKAVFYDEEMNFSEISQKDLKDFIKSAERLLLNANKQITFRKV